MDSLLRGASKFINEYMGEVLVKVLLILSMDYLLRGVSNFVNGYMGEVCLKGVANFINGFFAKRSGC